MTRSESWPSTTDSTKDELHALHARLHAEVVEHVHVAVIDGARLRLGGDDPPLLPRLGVLSEGEVEERQRPSGPRDGEGGVVQGLRRGVRGQARGQLADALRHGHQLVRVGGGSGVDALDGVELLRKK